MPEHKGIRPLVKEYRLLWKALDRYEEGLKERGAVTSSDEERGDIDAELQDVELCRKLLAQGMKSDWGVEPEASA
jgi:hypothetical protein